VKSKSGRLYTAVILVETRKGNWRASALQNDILKWLVGYKGRARSVKVKAPISTKDLWKNTMTHSDARYYVQTGSFGQQPTKEYLMRLERLGLHYKVEHTDVYKVLVGAYSDENDARDALVKVRSHVNEGAFITKL
jgi:D-alanyl-D-alanine carboxypeptidase/D-alanyl-D-alanine-endopeptidase (penicillin-binding protein 4)